MRLKWNMKNVVVVCAMVACGGNQGTQPEDMSASGHRAAASEADEDSQRHQGDVPDAHRARELEGTEMDVVYGTGRYNPSDRHRELADEYRALAERHRQAAAALEAFESAECGSFPASTRASCPLLGQLASAEDIPLGIRLVFHEDVDADAVHAHIRCHVAFASTLGREAESHCPLFLPGVRVEKDAGATLLMVEEESQVTSLRETIRAHIAR